MPSIKITYILRTLFLMAITYPLPAVVAGGWHHLAAEGLGHAAVHKGPDVALFRARYVLLLC